MIEYRGRTHRDPLLKEYVDQRFRRGERVFVSHVSGSRLYELPVGGDSELIQLNDGRRLRIDFERRETGVRAYVMCQRREGVDGRRF